MVESWFSKPKVVGSNPILRSVDPGEHTACTVPAYPLCRGFSKLRSDQQFIQVSSNGKTVAFEATYRGPSPCT